MHVPPIEERIEFGRKLIALQEEAISRQRSWIERLGPATRDDKWSEKWKAELRGSIARLEAGLPELRAGVAGLESELRFGR